MSQHVVPPIKPRYIGRRVLRSEDPRLLTGRGRYIADLPFPDALDAAFVRSPLAHARVVGVDVSEALAAPGVRAVWTGHDARRLCPDGIPTDTPIEGMAIISQPVLAFDVVRYVGEPVAVVVADSRALAEDAADLVAVEFEELEAVTDAEAALRDPPLANEDVPGNVLLDQGLRWGDPGAAFENAAITVRDRFSSSRYAAVPMETRGGVACFDWADARLTYWTATQMPHTMRTLIAAVTGFPEHQLEVRSPDVGGSFGQKSHLFPEDVALCLLAHELDMTVRWIEDRRENLTTATHAKQQVNTMEIAFDGDGHVLGLRDEIIVDGGAYNSNPWTQLTEGAAAASAVTSVYRVPAVETRLLSVMTNKCPVGAYRGIGWTAPQIAREALFDRAAHELSLSPFEIRRRNVVRPGEFPYETGTGHVLEEGSYLASIDLLEESVGYEGFRERQAQMRERGEYLGLGISVYNELSGVGTRGLKEIGFNFTSHDTSTVRMEPTGQVTVTTSIVAQGQGNMTTLRQVAADALGVRYEDVAIRGADSNQTYGMGTWGSRGAVIGSGSIARAASVIRDKVKLTAAHLLEAAADDLVLEDGRAFVGGSPAQGMSIADVAAVIYFDEAARPPGLDPTLESTAAYDPSAAIFSNGAYAVILRVDPELGTVALERFVVVDDCGQVINPLIVHGQILGGLAQAIGGALLEEFVYDGSGQLLTTTFLDYLLPTAVDVAPVELHHLETPSEISPAGVKGMAEAAMIAAPAAIVNGVNDAIAPLGGEPLVSVPLTPERILRALGRLGDSS